MFEKDTQTAVFVTLIRLLTIIIHEETDTRKGFTFWDNPEDDA